MFQDPLAPVIQKQPKKVVIETWGCQMNVADSEKILGLLEKHHYTRSDDVEGADLILLNTCNIREKAKHKVISRLGRLKEYKDNNPNMIIVVAGCIAQMEAEDLLKKSAVIDIILGPGKTDLLPELLVRCQSEGGPLIATGFAYEEHEFEAKDENEALIKPTLSGKNDICRYVNIIHGCENYCTYCVVPYARGKEKSRSTQEIVDEARLLIQHGAREITLLGQNVNSYGLDLDTAHDQEAVPPFVTLIKEVLKLSDLLRLRFTTSNPHNVSKNLIDLFAAEPRLGRYLHLPVQSGNNEILKRMNRKLTREEYLEKIAWLRASPSFIALSTDLIVGFPGETEAQFEDTIELVRLIRYSFIFAFKYSPRSGTPAASFPDQIDEKVKKQRLARLLHLQDEITLQQNKEEIGSVRTALIGYKNKKETNSYYGRTDEYRLVKISSPVDIVGQLIEVKIVDANKTALTGTLLN